MFWSAEVLALSNNNFWGQIIDSFEALSSLRTIDLSTNVINGVIPSTVFNLSKIRLVYLSNNELTGTLPSNVGSAPELRDLYVDGNKLSGEIPPIENGQLPNLNELLVRRFRYLHAFLWEISSLTLLLSVAARQQLYWDNASFNLRSPCSKQYAGRSLGWLRRFHRQCTWCGLWVLHTMFIRNKHRIVTIAMQGLAIYVVIIKGNKKLHNKLLVDREVLFHANIIKASSGGFVVKYALD